MIEEHAVVISIPDNQVRQLTPHAIVSLERKVACGICGQKRGCGNATWGALLGYQTNTFVVENTVNARVGDSVVIGIEEQALLGSIAYMYVLPLLGMVVGALISNAIATHEAYVFLGAMLGLVLTFLAVKRFLIKVHQSDDGSKLHHLKPLKNGSYQSKILRIDVP